MKKTKLQAAILTALIMLASFTQMRAQFNVVHSDNGSIGQYTDLGAAINACTISTGDYTITVSNNGAITTKGTVLENVKVSIVSDQANTSRTVTRTSSGCIVVNNLGTLDVSDIVLDGNNSTNTTGIQNNGTTTLNRCVVQNWNGENNGGGIMNTGVLSLNETSLFNNTPVNGAGVYNAGTLNITGGTIGGSAEKKNHATNVGGGIYKDGTLNVQGTLNITCNTAVSSTADNVYIATSDSQPYILITGNINNGSRIGVTKRKSGTRFTYTDFKDMHNFTNDDNLDEVRTVIAKVSNDGDSYAWNAYKNNVFFDDDDRFNVWCFDYHQTNAYNDYSDQNIYFIETWRSFADPNGFNSNTVSSNAGFAHFATLVNSGTDFSGVTIHQSDYIDLSGHYWEPIGFSTSSDCSSPNAFQFSGTYDGHGHFISGITSILPTQTMCLFGKVTGIVRHTFAVSSNLVYTNENTGCLGAIASEVSGTIDGCEAAGFTLNGHAPTVSAGGIVGSTSGEVRNSFTSGITFKGTITNAGGLAGSIASSGAVRNCYSKVMPAVGTNKGALAGNNDGTINNAYTSATEGTIVGTGKNGTNVYSAGAANAAIYTPTICSDQLGYMYADNTVGSGNDKRSLFEALTHNARYMNTTASAPIYDDWARPALAYYINDNGIVKIEKPINDDLPVLLMDNYSSDAKHYIGQGGFRSVSNYNGSVDILQYSGPNRDGNGNTTTYLSEIDGMLSRSKNSDSHFIYGDVASASTVDVDAKHISIYEHAAIPYAGTLGLFPSTHVSITFDNSRAESDNPLPVSSEYMNSLGEQKLNRDWHLLSTPLLDASTGFNYYLNDLSANTNTSGYTSGDGGGAGEFFNNPWQTGENGQGNNEFGWLGGGNNRYWMTGWTGSLSNTSGGYSGIELDDEAPNKYTNGYFPTTFDATLHRFNQGCFEGTDENGRYPYGMDFYSWTEPNYHYINFKRNGPNHWHSDPNANGEHDHLAYKPEIASNYASPHENVNEEILLAGKGYFASIAEKTLLQSSGQLGGNATPPTPPTPTTKPTVYRVGVANWGMISPGMEWKKNDDNGKYTPRNNEVVYYQNSVFDDLDTKREWGYLDFTYLHNLKSGSSDLSGLYLIGYNETNRNQQMSITMDDWFWMFYNENYYDFYYDPTDAPQYPNYSYQNQVL